ncbi:hypothetical protein [Endozoicomonas sp. ISHI1]|uniref:hypothetical protein n=3 Tax=unclassified Endozoicomonas TaxID=2644528 RepID=UPI002147A4C9|nr:hypothetical protein [Endozoicomonas sp. ISHI1]
MAGFSYSETDNQDYGEDEHWLNTLSPVDFAFHSTSPSGLFFRVGNDFTFRRYGDYLSLNGLRTLPSLASNAMMYWMVSRTTAYVLSRWTANPLTLHTAQVLSMAILPGVKSALYSWYTGTRLGSEQIQVDPPHIRKRFYLELIYQQESHQQILRITPFPLSPPTSTWLAEKQLSGGYSPWLELYEASSQHGVVHIDLSWVSPEAPEGIRIDIHYSDKATESTLVALTHSEASETLPVSIESLLHNEAKDELKAFAKGHSIASLLTDAVIRNTVTLIHNPDSALARFPVSRVAGQLEFEADGNSGQLSLCGEQQPDCHSHLQLTYKLFPYPHFGMTLQGQDRIESSVDATIKQLANANRAELILQLLEKAVLHFFMASVQKNNQESKNTGNDYFQPSLQHNEGIPETAIAPSYGKLVAPLQLLVKTMMPEGGIWKSGKCRNALSILWGLHPGLFRNLMVESEALSPGSLNIFKISSDANTAIFTEKQVELIQKLVDGRVREFTEDEFMNVIDYFSPRTFRKYGSEAYLESPFFMKEFVRNGVLQIHEIPKEKITKDIILAQPGYDPYQYSYDDLPVELKKEVDFLIEYSNIHGMPYGTPPELAVFIYGYLDTTAKIKSLNNLPASFKNDDLYDDLIRSGIIELKDLPEHIKEKNKEYCLSQLSNDLCKLSEVPVHFMTKESILNSISGVHWFRNFNRILFPQYSMFTKDPVFFEEILVKALAYELEAIKGLGYSYGYIFTSVYNALLNRYKTDEEAFGLLLKKLVKVNPFILIYVEDFNAILPKDLIDAAKRSLLDMLSSRPEVSERFHMTLLYHFFGKVSADNDFITHVLNIVYPYLPEQNYNKLSEVILKEQDKIVLNSEVFDKGKWHFLIRKLRPANPHIAIDYIERHLNFFDLFDDKEYLERCCTDDIIRKRLIHILVERLVANKPSLLMYWKDRLPPQLIDDTLDFLKDPALFFKLDSSDQLTEPVNPLNFQLPNPSALKLVVAAHAFDIHPEDLASGRQLQSEFARAGETVFQRVYPGQHPLSLFEQEGTIVGGRTLAIVNGEEVDYYKFHRVGEFEATLAQEGIMHQFIAKSDRFRSQKPRFGQYLIVQEKDLPKSTRDFTDRLQFRDVGGERACLVYHFKATNDYGKYAHTPDDTSTPYTTAEQGLLNSIHDIGVLNGKFGIMPTSTIPSFHAVGRRWVFLSPLLGNSDYYAFPLPGDFDGWIEAIERPDFGWSGLRDWGDVEFYGSMKSGLGSKDSKTWGYTPEVLQRLSFANAMCENLLAAVLLRSRLRRDSPDYFYQNPKTLKETENFIEQLLNEYLSGLFAKEIEVQPKPRLQKIMQLDDGKYRSWLTRTAQEILYWTALQPDEVPDRCAFTPSSECYSEHLKRTGHLDKILYPKPLHPLDAQKAFPRDFRNDNDQLNLGADNGVFPLVSLAKGLTLFASKIFAFADQYTEEGNRE